MVVLLSVLKKLFEGWFGSEAVCLSLDNGHFSRKKQGAREKYFPFYITNGQNKSECHDFVSQTFPSHFTTDIFHRKLGTLFQIFFAFIDSLSI
jgi:hypothetical protein